MANFKKGVALVLAAATAFTFAPVSTLGTPVVAEAAAVTVPVAQVAASGLELTITGTNATPVSNAISLNDVKFAGVTTANLESSDATVAAVPATVDLTSDDSFTITGKKAGSATITVKAGTTEVYTIHVSVRDASVAAIAPDPNGVRVGGKFAAAPKVTSAYDATGSVVTAITSSDKTIYDPSKNTAPDFSTATFEKAGSVTLTFTYAPSATVGGSTAATATVSKTYTVLPAAATLTVEGQDASKVTPGVVKIVELTKENASYQINATLTNAEANKKVTYSEDSAVVGFALDTKTGLVTASAEAFKTLGVPYTVTVNSDDTNGNFPVKVQFVAVSETKKLTSLKVTADGQEKEAKATLDKTGYNNVAIDGSASFDKVVLSTDDKQTLDLAVVATPDKAVITSDDKSVVEVNGTTLTAKKAGKANVTVKVASDANYFGNATITIPVEVIAGKANNTIVTNSVTLSKTVKTAKDYATATVDKTVLSYRFVKYDAATKTYVADNPTDVTLDAKTGELKYITENAGSVIVEVTGKAPAGAADPKPAYVTVSYSNKKEASKLAVATKSVNVEAGKTAAIAATGTALTFASSDESIATVAADGTVTGVKTGVAIITVTDAGDENTEGGSVDVPVYVKARAAVVIAKPAKVTGLKVANVKGAKVKVSFKKSAKAAGYVVTYKIGKKTYKKTITSTSTKLSVKKGAKVTVTVKAFNYKDGNVKQFGAASKAVSKKTDKK